MNVLLVDNSVQTFLFHSYVTSNIWVNTTYNADYIVLVMTMSTKEPSPCGAAGAVVDATDINHWCIINKNMLHIETQSVLVQITNNVSN